jgi:hypothetical protein
MRALHVVLFLAFVLHVARAECDRMPEGLVARLRATSTLVEVGQTIGLVIELENRGEERLVLDRRCWDPRMAPPGSSRFLLRDLTRGEKSSVLPVHFFRSADLGPLGSTDGLPPDLVLEILPKEVATIHTALGGPLDGASVAPPYQLARPGEWEILYVPHYVRATKEVSVWDVPYRVTVSVVAPDLPRLEELVEAGGSAWYAALIVEAERSPEKLFVLLESSIDAQRKRDVINALSLVPKDRQEAAISVLSKYLDDERTLMERTAVLTATRAIGTESAIPVLEKLIERTRDADTLALSVRYGAARAAGRIDPAKGRALAEKALAMIAEVPEGVVTPSELRLAERGLERLRVELDEAVGRIEKDGLPDAVRD